MTSEESLRLLARHGVKPTANRIQIIRAIAERGEPLSMHEIEAQLMTVDKSVISRTLSLFRQFHLVHTIDGPDGIARYEACLSHSAQADDDEHAHFYCERCRRTFCLYGVPQPRVALPDGFEQHEVSVVVSGVCPQCRGMEKKNS